MDCIISLEKNDFQDCKHSIAEQADPVGPGLPSITDDLGCLPIAAVRFSLTQEMLFAVGGGFSKNYSNHFCSVYRRNFFIIVQV